MTRPTLLLLLLLTTACTDADPGRGTAKACDPCTWDGDCADGFFCDTANAVMVCRTPKMAEELAATQYPQCDRDCWQKCLASGSCEATPEIKYGTDTVRAGCRPTAMSHCANSEACAKQGECTYCQEMNPPLPFGSCRKSCN